MTSIRTHLGCALLLLVLIAWPGGAVAQHHGEAEAHPERRGSHEGEAKNHNDRYLDPELDVDEYTDRFESESREVYAHREAIVNALELSLGMTVADIGAGTGAFMGPLLDRIGPTGHYFAVEIAPRFVEHVRDRAITGGRENVTSVLGGFDSAMLPVASVDLIFLCDTYHHFENPDAMLRSMHRALRPGGRLAIVEFNRVEGKSREWVLDHIRASRDVFAVEIESAGFAFEREVKLEGLVDNFYLLFVKQ